MTTSDKALRQQLDDLRADRDGEGRRQDRREIGVQVAIWLGGSLVLVGGLWAGITAATHSQQDWDAKRAAFWRHTADQTAACRAAGGFPILTWGTYGRDAGPVYSGCMPKEAK